jgi:hypothetical protein
MSEPAHRYPDWKAPAEDGGVLVWPEPEQLLGDARANHARLSRESGATVQNVPLNQVRKRLREFVGHDDARPLLASGHQTELYHAGVWVKDALINAAARRIDGSAFHIAVDTDAPKHLVLRWPGGSAPVTDDPKLTTAAWSGLLEPPSPAHLQDVASAFGEVARGWDFEPLLPHVLDSLRRLALESNSLSSALTNAQHELDWSLGLRHHALLASPIWGSEPFLLFAHHVLARADQFASDYNAALAAYRAEHGIRSTQRPMPDLFTGDDSIEMPFWLDDLAAGTRARPSVFRAPGGSFVLQLLSGDEFTFDASLDGWEAAHRLSRFLTSSAHRLAPRALTLTMFTRLCLVDQFAHGIGGGRYDQVTDRLIARHFRLEPPGFCVTTATMFLPQAVGRQRVCVPCVLHEGHRLRHNLLGRRKRELVEQIASAPRGSPRRQVLFHEMHNALDAAAAGHPALEHWRRELEETKHREREEQSLFDRELFYAMQPRERLIQMIARYEDAFTI